MCPSSRSPIRAGRGGDHLFVGLPLHAGTPRTRSRLPSLYIVIASPTIRRTSRVCARLRPGQAARLRSALSRGEGLTGNTTIRDQRRRLLWAVSQRNKVLPLGAQGADPAQPIASAAAAHALAANERSWPHRPGRRLQAGSLVGPLF